MVSDSCLVIIVPNLVIPVQSLQGWKFQCSLHLLIVFCVHSFCVEAVNKGDKSQNDISSLVFDLSLSAKCTYSSWKKWEFDLRLNVLKVSNDILLQNIAFQQIVFANGKSGD